MATLNYSTRVPLDRTVGEVQAMLAAHGADAVAIRYEDRQPAGMTFRIVDAVGPRSFNLPVDVDAVQRLIAQQFAAKTITTKSMSRDLMLSREHAAAVAWRVAKDWLEAQLAIIEAQMVTLEQVMLPYLVVDSAGTTMWDAYLDSGTRAIEGRS